MPFYGDGKHDTGIICTPRARKKRVKTLDEIKKDVQKGVSKVKDKLSNDVKHLIVKDAKEFLLRYPNAVVIKLGRYHVIASAVVQGHTAYLYHREDPFLGRLYDMFWWPIAPELPIRIEFVEGKINLVYE
jgi:hypothetical protein